MTRSAFKMKLRPGNEAEYQKRHDEIWPELKEALSAAGISDYTIYLDEETNILFAVWTLADDNTVDRLPELPIMRKWWDFMSEMMETHPDGTPMSRPLREVFHMD